MREDDCYKVNVTIQYCCIQFLLIQLESSFDAETNYRITYARRFFMNH